MSDYVKFSPQTKMQELGCANAKPAKPAKAGEELTGDFSNFSDFSVSIPSHVHFSLCAVCGHADWRESLYSPTGWHCAHCGTPRSTESGAPPRPGRVGRYQKPCQNCGETWFWPTTRNAWRCSGCVVRGHTPIQA